MLKPDRVILKLLKAYDQNLEPRWNNQHKYWEIWYRRPTGWKLITPVVEGIYKTGGSAYKFERLDYRILDWIASSDSSRCRKWKWLSKRRFFDKKNKERKRSYHTLTNIAKDNYSWMQKDLFNPYLHDVSKPVDVYGSTTKKRISYGKRYEGGAPLQY